MTLDLDVICISGVPITGIAAFSAASARQIFLRDGEFVRLASADHKFTLAAAADLAGDGAVKEAVAQSFHHDPFEMCERLSNLAAMRANNRGNRSFMHCAAESSCP